jgi:hypothetical protein
MLAVALSGYTSGFANDRFTVFQMGEMISHGC